MSTPDVINASFELLGGALCWVDVRRLRRDKLVRGVSWPIRGFFSAWGFWNIFYYSALQQPLSLLGGVVLAVGNTAWVLLAAYYGRRAK